MMKKGREAKEAYLRELPRSRPDATPEAEARALASIYERAIERSKQKQRAAEVHRGERRTEIGPAEKLREEPPARKDNG